MVRPIRASKFVLSILVASLTLMVIYGSAADETTGSLLAAETDRGTVCREVIATTADAGPLPSQGSTVCPVCGSGQLSKASIGDTLGNTACCHVRPVDWSNVPQNLRLPARFGHSWLFPSGPGYYSLTDTFANHWRDRRPPSGYPPFALMAPSFFDSDWRYVDQLSDQGRTLVEHLKRMPIGDCWLLSLGGQYWSRYMHEVNSRLLETDNDYLLGRIRMWGDVWYADLARVYGEFLWADSFAEDLPSLAIDVNRGDILNLFVDVRLTDWFQKPLFVRLGRQELAFGSHRLVSTLDWANTRRTFEGVRFMWQGDNWDLDWFWTQFVPPRASDFDRADSKQEFAGTWFTYRPKAGHFFEVYYLYANNHHNVSQQGIAIAPFDLNTVGVRFFADETDWLYEVETAVQFGRRAGQEVTAGMTSAGLGRRFSDVYGEPLWWVYYDWASGDRNPNAGTSTTFGQLYPFGHYYLGWIDLVGRQNIQDLNTHLIFFPNRWTTVWLQYHHFWLAENRDALYNAGGVATRRDASGASGRNVGDEVDIVTNVHLNRYSDLLFGFSKLYGGSFLKRTAGSGGAFNSELFYIMYNRRW